jgi:hypothetical protein
MQELLSPTFLSGLARSKKPTPKMDNRAEDIMNALLKICTKNFLPVEQSSPRIFKKKPWKEDC